MSTLPPLDVLLEADCDANAFAAPPLLAVAETFRHSMLLASALPPELTFSFRVPQVPDKTAVAPLDTLSSKVSAVSPSARSDEPELASTSLSSGALMVRVTRR